MASIAHFQTQLSLFVLFLLSSSQDGQLCQNLLEKHREACLSLSDGGIGKLSAYTQLSSHCEGIQMQGGAVLLMLSVDVVGYLIRSAAEEPIYHPIHVILRSLDWVDGARKSAVDFFARLGICLPRACAGSEDMKTLRDELRLWLLESVVDVGLAKLDGPDAFFKIWRQWHLNSLRLPIPGVDFGSSIHFCSVISNISSVTGPSCQATLLTPKLQHQSQLPLSVKQPSLAALAIKKDRDKAIADGKWYIVILSSDNYLAGVLVLYHSLLRSRTRYPFIVAVTSSVSNSSQRLLLDLGVNIINLPDAGPMPNVILNKDSIDAGWWEHSNARFHIYSRLDSNTFRKVVNVDADTMVLRNIDDLFDKPIGSAYCQPYGETGDDEINIGVVVLRPDPEYDGLREYYINDLHNGGSLRHQRIINSYMGRKKIFLRNQSLHLDQSYNAFVEELDKIVHHKGLYLQGLVPFGDIRKGTLSKLWRCTQGGFDHCCNEDGTMPHPRLADSQDDACIENGIDHQICCQGIKKERLVKLVHFVLRKPWQMNNASKIDNKGRALGPIGKRAYEQWFDAAFDATAQFSLMLRILDAKGVEARDIFAAGDGV